MKVGAGGLQSQVMFETDAVRREGMLRTDSQARTVVVPELNRNIPEIERLVRLVEQLNTAAALVNYPFRFRIRRVKDSPSVFRHDVDEPDLEEEVSLEELETIRRQLQREGNLDESV
ncbi:MAG: hypothetical protein AB1510_03510 [Bacillota bacterium]